MQHLKIFVELTRLDKPIGFMLLFWPCSWGLAYAYSFNENLNLFLYYLLLFFLGSVLMSSAGCIFNDVVDKDFDKKVNRTKTRPIPSGRISIKQSLVYVLILCFAAFLVLIQFNKLTIILGMSSMLLAFSYPFMKRITYWPQLFLGITFNWGIVMAWAAMNNDISIEMIVLYLSAIFWTLGYDTIYGAQDMSEDEIIGVKSTSIKFKKNLKLFIFSSYLIFIIGVFSILRNSFGLNVMSLIFIVFLSSILIQVKLFNVLDNRKCLRLFKLNNFSGLTLFLTILLINF